MNNVISYKKGELFFGGQAVSKLAQKYKTPFYAYDLGAVRARARTLKAHLPKNTLIQYAMKSNSNVHILKLLKKQGLGLDVVSGGELKLGLAAGFKPNQIVFSGVGKTTVELRLALTKKIRSINVESFAELERILLLARQLKTSARVSLRVNPDVSAKTHRHITTGKKTNKFGLSKLELQQTLALLDRNRANLNLIGLTFHLGSQIQSVAPYRAAFGKIKKLVLDLLNEGYPLEHLSVGGGMAIQYSTEKNLDLKTFGQFVRGAFRGLPVRPMCEPGRVLVGEAGILVTEVQYIKNTGSTRFAIVDTGMHHLMRPALYGAFHEIVPLQMKNEKLEVYEVVGPICESTDILGRHRKFAGLRAGDRLAILNAGAYGFVMANRYNTHALPAEVIVRNNGS